jgi:hypothetical protein
VSPVVLVHGIGQQYKGPESLLAECVPGLRDGVAFAGGVLDPGDVSVAFYGDLFRPRGVRSLELPDYDVSDVRDPFELELLRAWWMCAAELEPAMPGPGAPTRVRTPRWTQRALYALSGTYFFGGLAERALIGSLKQVQAYFTDRDLREQARGRLLERMTADTAVVVGHSLGSVVAYEALCALPDTSVSTLITLGSPLGLPKLVLDRLVPDPRDGHGRWPGRVRQWTNIADAGDVVANPKSLAPLFGPELRDVAIHNGAKAHDIRPYLTARETGLAVRRGMGDQTR